MAEPLLTRYLQPLLAGRRAECFRLIQNWLDAGTPALELIHEVVWPAMVQVDRLYRGDRITMLQEGMACRINRVASDRLQPYLRQAPPRERRMIVLSTEEPREELGAQMLADLLQADGWEVYFAGHGAPDDEILELVGRLRPATLLIFGSRPQAVPQIRRLVDHVREIGVCPTMNVVVSGGVFNRAEGLWREVGADYYSESPKDLVTEVAALPPRPPGTQRVGVVKKRRRRRRSAMVTA